MKNYLKIFIIFLCIFLIQGCVKRATTTLTAKIVTDGMSALESEPDLWIANQSIIPLMTFLEVLKGSDPDNPAFLALMSQIYGNVAFGFFEPRYLTAPGEGKDIWRKRMERYYRMAYEAGFISLKSRLGRRINRGIKKFEMAVARAQKWDIDRLFWTAFGLGNWINLNRDDVGMVAKMPMVSAMIERVLKLDPEFGYGSALAFKAAILASKPKMLGGDPEKAKELFEEAIEMYDGRYLMTKVTFAEKYAIPQGDVKMARRLLDEVIVAGDDIFPEQALANRLAKERAKILSKGLR